MRHNWREILSILIWVMVGAVGVGITWLIDLYSPTFLEFREQQRGPDNRFSGLVCIRSRSDNIEWPFQLALQRGHAQD